MTERQSWEEGEPTVEELLSDPIVDFLLRRDGLTPHDVRHAVEAARRNLHRSRGISSAAA